MSWTPSETRPDLRSPPGGPALLRIAFSPTARQPAGCLVSRQPKRPGRCNSSNAACWCPSIARSSDIPVLVATGFRGLLPSWQPASHVRSTGTSTPFRRWPPASLSTRHPAPAAEMAACRVSAAGTLAAAVPGLRSLGCSAALRILLRLLHTPGDGDPARWHRVCSQSTEARSPRPNPTGAAYREASCPAPG